MRMILSSLLLNNRLELSATTESSGEKNNIVDFVSHSVYDFPIGVWIKILKLIFLKPTMAILVNKVLRAG